MSEPAPNGHTDISYLNGANATYLDALFQQYQDNPDSVSEHWRNVFESIPELEQDVDSSQSGNSDKKDGFASEEGRMAAEAYLEAYVPPTPPLPPQLEVMEEPNSWGRLQSGLRKRWLGLVRDEEEAP